MSSSEIRARYLEFFEQRDHRRIPSASLIPTTYDPSTLFIEIQYRPKDTNDHRNLVFPFYTIPDDPESDY